MEKSTKFGCPQTRSATHFSPRVLSKLTNPPYEKPKFGLLKLSLRYRRAQDPKPVLITRILVFGPNELGDVLPLPTLILGNGLAKPVVLLRRPLVTLAPRIGVVRMRRHPRRRRPFLHTRCPGCAEGSETQKRDPRGRKARQATHQKASPPLFFFFFIRKKKKLPPRTSLAVNQRSNLSPQSNHDIAGKCIEDKSARH